MFTLTEDLNNKFEWEGKIYHVDMSFNNVLKVFDLFEDDLFDTYEKIPITLEMMIVEYKELGATDFAEVLALYNFILKEFLWIDNKSNKESSKKVIDFKKDAGAIYASFLSEYGIDLFEQQNKLHWHKFSELLGSLGEDTAFKKVLGYRTMKIPSSKEASKEYRDHIRKMKRIYALEQETDASTLDKKLDAIANSFK